MSLFEKRFFGAAVGRWSLAMTLGLGLVGCPSSDPDTGEEPEVGVGEIDGVESATDGDESASEGPAPLTAERLRPIIRAVGAQGVSPRTITVAFSRDVFESEIVDVGWRQEVAIPSPKGNVLEISPEMSGQLTITSATTLSFTPDEPFAPSTQYKVALKSVKVGDETFDAPSEKAWQHTFSTPKFAFVRANLTAFNPKKGTADINLVFSHAVEPAAVRPFISLTLDKKAITPTSVGRTLEPNVVQVGVKASKLKYTSASVGVKVKAGAPLAADPSLGAPSGEASVEIRRGEPVEIQTSRRMESDNGHYLDIICDDKAAPGGTRWYWDDVNYDSYRISSRCQLTESSAEESIHFDPAVNFYVAPSDAGFRIFGDFNRGSYSLRIDAGARSIDGGLLAQTYEKEISIPPRAARVNFVSKGRYLPREAWGHLAISHLNIDEVEVTIRHVPAKNLQFWMSGNSEVADERTSNVVAKTSVPVRGKEDEVSNSWIDVGTLVPEPAKGVYELNLSARGKSDSARLLLTDMNLLAKAHGPAKGKSWPRAISVWALDMDTAQGLAGVKMNLVRKSGQSMATCSTDQSGGCTLAVPDKGVDSSGPFAVIASQGDDLTYLKFEELQTPVGDDAVQGEPYLSERPYRSSIYSDRGVYRPGETAHVAAILRDGQNKAPKADMPVSMVVKNPRGNVFKKLELRTNGAGMISADLAFEAYADTGRYEAVIEIGGKVAGSYSFNVEEFVPERMKVTVESVKPAWLASETPKFNVEAQYLFGGTADGSAVEVNCYLEASSFKPDNNSQYEYAIWRDKKESGRMSLGTVTAQLDDKGTAEVACPSSGGGEVAGPSRVVAEVAVFESGSGRTTRGQAGAAVHPKRYYLGMMTSAEKALSGKEITVEGVVVDWDGRLVKDALTSVEMRYLRMEAEYSWYWYEGADEETFERRLRAIPWGKDDVAVKGGRFRFKVTPTQRVDAMLIRVKADGAQTDLQLEGEYRYWWGPSESRVDQTPRPMKPTSLSLKVEGPALMGKASIVALEAPYKGRLLMTVETDTILTTQWLDVEAGPVTWSYTPDTFVPNLYVSAFLIKDPHLDSAEAYRPDRAFGVTSVKVKPEAFTYEMKLNAPKEIRSNSRLKVDLDIGKTDGPTFVTVAAVDEGILSLTGFKDPDPFKSIFARRALGVDTFETVGWTLLVPPGGPSASHGGGAEADPGRVQPVKPVALWSGVVEVPSNGKVTVSFDVPLYRGSLRVMAVAAGQAKMGHAATSVLVRDPLVLQATLPRFLIDGDEIQIPVFVTNLSGSPQDVTIKLNTESIAMAGIASVMDPIPPLQLLGSKEGRIRLADGENGTVVFQARARKKVGAARLKIEASAGDLISYEELEVPFAPNGPRERMVQRIELSQGKNDVTQYLTGWVPTSEQSTLWVTSNPYGQSFDHLKHLVRYPYGCIEQTTSSTRPLLYVSNLLYNVDPGLIQGTTIDKMVASGVNRILSMQTPEGGFAYWPGGNHPVWWGTAYATHMLLDAKRLGHPVSPTALDAAVGWIESQLTERPSNNQNYYWGSFDRAEPYLHYVAALAGKGRKARVTQLIEAMPKKLGGAESEHLYMLQAALYLAGDHRYERALKNPDISALTGERKNNWSFYSDLRRRGFVLNAFQDLFEGDDGGEALADLVARGLAQRKSSWYTTQELVWGVTALGRWVTSGSGDFKPPTLTANGKARDARPVEKTVKVSDRTWSLARASEYRQLEIKMKPFDAENVYLMLMSEGVREGATYEYGGNGLKLTRTYRNMEGNKIDPQKLALGDMVYVDVVLKNTSKEGIQNVAVVDRLPAGWEIENPRLGRGGSVDWVDGDDLWSSDYMNLRDDRVEVFGNLKRGETVRFVYAARAVTSGTFTAPPIEAEAMYEPSLWAREPGGAVNISGPWADYLL